MSETTQQTTAGGPNAALKEAPPKPGEGVDPNHPAAAHATIVSFDPPRVEVTPRRKKIAICGFASSSRGAIPAADPSYEIWGLNQLYRHIPRADRWFDIHENWREELVPGTDHEGWLAQSGIPVYMGQRQETIPTSLTYPLAGIIDRLGADYFTSSISYMVALAIDEVDRWVADDLAALLAGTFGSEAQPERVLANPVKTLRDLYGQYIIALFGIDLIVGEEYDWQKACAEFWIGQACGRGIRIQLPFETALCKHMYRYGYAKEPESPILLSEIDAASAQLQQQKNDAMRTLFMCDGALQRDAHWRQLLQLRLRGLVKQ